MADRNLNYRVAVDTASVQAAAAQLRQTMGREMAQVESATSGAAGGSDKLRRNLEALAPGVMRFAGPAGLGLAVAAAGKLTVELGNLGESALRSERFFTAFSGSAQQAAANLEAVKRATEGGVSNQQAMTQATRYLSMGLAKNSDDLYKLSRMAVMLGGNTRTATESMEEFALLLANQSILRLDTFGISGARVRQRIEELMEADKGLSREQAFLNAVMEQGEAKVRTLEQANTSATTSAEKLAAAWANLRTEIGKGIAPGVSRAQEALANAMNAVANGRPREPLTEVTPAEAQRELARRNLAEATRGVEEAQRQLAEAQRSGDQAAIDEARQAVATAIALQQQQREALNAATAVDTLTNAMQRGVAVAQAYSMNLPTSLSPQKAPLMGQMSFASGGEGIGLPIGVAQRPLHTAWTDNYFGWWKTTTEQQFDIKTIDQVNAELARSAKSTERAWDSAANKAQQAFERAAEQVQDAFTGAVNNAINASKGLTPKDNGAPGIWEPGGNGPFEALFRAKDVAINRDKSKWLGEGGLSMDELIQASQQFEMGNVMNPLVQRLINRDALAGGIQQQFDAQKQQGDFAAQMAQMLGQQPAAVAQMLGFSGGATEAGALAGVGKKTVDDMTAQLKDKANEKDIGDAGRQLARWMGEAWLDEINRTGWASAMRQAILNDLIRIFGGDK